MISLLKSLPIRLKCLITGHNIIVDYPVYEQFTRDGVYSLVGKRVYYCNKCKRALKRGKVKQ